jgi:hypothetical protein
MTKRLLFYILQLAQITITRIVTGSLFSVPDYRPHRVHPLQCHPIPIRSQYPVDHQPLPIREPLTLHIRHGQGREGQIAVLKLRPAYEEQSV